MYRLSSVIGTTDRRNVALNGSLQDLLGT